MSVQACALFTPHIFIKKSRCRECNRLESEHSSSTSSDPSATISLEDKLNALLRKDCTHYIPHAWLVDKCRECGRGEALHESSELEVAEAAAPSRVGKLDPALLRQEEKEADTSSTAAQALSNKRASATYSTAFRALQQPFNATAAPPSPQRAAVAEAQRQMQHAVAQMVLMDEEFEEVQALQFAQLKDRTLSEAEFEASMQEVRVEFVEKEAELRAEVEKAKAALEEEKKREAEQAQQDRTRHAEPAEAMRQESAALQRERELALQTHAAHSVDVAASASALDTTLDEDDVADLDTDATASPDEPAIASAPASSAASDDTSSIETSSIPLTSSSVDETSVADIEQPTAESKPPPSNPYKGTVNLNEVLLKVESLFLYGKTYWRFFHSRTEPAVCSLFLRVIEDEYVLCWSPHPDSLIVHPACTMPFSTIQSFVIGRQATLWQSIPEERAPNDVCLSIVGASHSLHLMALNQHDVEMTAFGLASLMKEARLPVSVFDSGQYHEAADARMLEIANEASEHNDSVPAIVVSESVVSDAAATAAVTTAPAHAIEAESSAATLKPALVSRQRTSSNFTPRPRARIELSVRCISMPMRHGNFVTCLVDRDLKTNELVYVDQTEMISHSTSPKFSTTFALDYELNASREIRFNVYDVPPGVTQLQERDRIGSLRVDARQIVDDDLVDFHFLLNHHNAIQNRILATARAQIVVQCIKKQLIASTSAVEVDEDSLQAMQTLLIKGALFLVHNAQFKPEYYCIRYNLPATASSPTPGHQVQERAFPLGVLEFYPQDQPTNTSTMALRSICDVFVGRKNPRVFVPSAPDDQCFSLVSKSGQRLDLETKSNQERQQWVHAITSLLKHASLQARKRAEAQLGLKE